MKYFILANCFLAVLFAFSQDEDWSNFKKQYNKKYFSLAEEQRRYLIYLDNIKLTREHNILYEKQEKSFALGQNKYSDMTHSEFLEHFRLNRNLDLSSLKKLNTVTVETSQANDVPKALNWVEKGAVTEVKDQGNCGSCWAFSTVGSMEGAYFLKRKKLVSFSAQQLLDCDKKEFGCGGGSTYDAYIYFTLYKPMPEKFYPYVARQGNCNYDESKAVNEIIAYFTQPKKNVDSVMESVSIYGPHSVLIDSGSLEFKHYKKGVFKIDNCSQTNPIHGVLLVGYGTENNLDYWLVKNSWSEDWGENGYVKMWKSNDNMCGIMNYAYGPKFKD